MTASLRFLALLLATVAAVCALAVGPALATEGGQAPEGTTNGKVEFPDTPHDRVGLVILGVSGVLVLAAGANAVKQLRGNRPQADGRIRWR